MNDKKGNIPKKLNVKRVGAADYPAYGLEQFRLLSFFLAGRLVGLETEEAWITHGGARV